MRKKPFGRLPREGVQKQPKVHVVQNDVTRCHCAFQVPTGDLISVLSVSLISFASLNAPPSSVGVGAFAMAVLQCPRHFHVHPRRFQLVFSSIF